MNKRVGRNGKKSSESELDELRSCESEELHFHRTLFCPSSSIQLSLSPSNIYSEWNVTWRAPCSPSSLLPGQQLWLSNYHCILSFSIVSLSLLRSFFRICHEDNIVFWVWTFDCVWCINVEVLWTRTNLLLVASRTFPRSRHRGHPEVPFQRDSVPRQEEQLERKRILSFRFPMSFEVASRLWCCFDTLSRLPSNSEWVSRNHGSRVRELQFESENGSEKMKKRGSDLYRMKKEEREKRKEMGKFWGKFWGKFFLQSLPFSIYYHDINFTKEWKHESV